MGEHVFLFSDDIGGHSAKSLLGGKGAGLRTMASLGIPVPPGFTISTETCGYWNENKRYPNSLENEVAQKLAAVEKDLERSFGGTNAPPLLLSVRSGAAVSMPGMMDTILNIGLNDTTVEALAEQASDRRFAFDAYRRLIAMFSDVVLGIEREIFERLLNEAKGRAGSPLMADSELSAEALVELTGMYKEVVERETGAPFPQDVRKQLWGAIDAVFQSWNNPRAIRYRRMQNITGLKGTAVTVQAMVFGNMGNDSGSGVAFTRNPSTGENLLYGEFLSNAQGEDVVAGVRTPLPLSANACAPGMEDETLERVLPDSYADFVAIAQKLESSQRDLQDIEFTIEKGKVFILQTRNGKRTAHAAVKIAADMVDEGLLVPDEAITRVEADALEQLLHASLPTPEVLEKRGIKALAQGLPASPGAAMGEIVFTADEAEFAASAGRKVILVRRETSPEDIHGMKAAEGIITATGGMTSHAAVVARGLGKTCVAGCSALSVDYQNKTVTVQGRDGKSATLKQGDVITLDGGRGLIYEGALEVVAAPKLPEFERVMAWADERRRLRVRANADTPEQARTARAYGAEGIGLCRTEHMFFADERLLAVRCLVLSEEGDRQRWIDKVEPMQREDFEGIFEAMDGLPVTVRLLDWPLHEFLPREKEEYQSVAEALGRTPEAIESLCSRMHETNPMLGHRGVRVGLTRPEIYEMQVRAIADAAAACKARGIDVQPEVMIPVVSLETEVALMKAMVTKLFNERLKAAKQEVAYLVGTMIELPRACLVANALATHAEFFSFGTNDLTQTTFGLSRDDAGRFLPAYLQDARGILESDPFSQLDESGPGELVRIACERGRATRASIKLGVCGEHGGDPASIAFCESLSLDYVSCSPPRIPVARLAAAQAHQRAKVSN